MKLRNFFVTTLALTAGLVLTNKVNAHPNLNQIEYLGQTELGHFFSDSDRVEFGRCDGPNNNPVNSIQLRVERSPVEIEELVIQFGNGQTERISVRSEFRPGSESRIIDLPGATRCVERAYITGRTMSFNSSQGVVKFYGFRSAPLPPPSRYKLIGVTNLEYDRDADSIIVSRCENNSKVFAKKIKLQILNNTAQIFDLKVRYGNGEVEDIPVRDFFEPGSWTVEKDLNGALRCITEIFVIGRTLNNNHNHAKAQVRVFGSK